MILVRLSLVIVWPYRRSRSSKRTREGAQRPASSKTVVSAPLSSSSLEVQAVGGNRRMRCHHSEDTGLSIPRRPIKQVGATERQPMLFEPSLPLEKAFEVVSHQTY